MPIRYSRLKEAEDEISKNLKGWITKDELVKILPLGINLKDVQEVKDFVNERDKIKMRSTGNTVTESAYFIEHKTETPYKEYKEQIPVETHDIFDKWVGKGNSPRVIVALIQYLTDPDKTVKRKIASKHDCCTASIRNNEEEMKEDLRKKNIKIEMEN